jgi:hypothetical protein
LLKASRRISTSSNTSRVKYPKQDAHKDNRKQPSRHIRASLAITKPLASRVSNVRIPLLALVGEGKRILDAAAALEHIWIICRGVALAYDVGATELELLGQGSCTAPFDVLLAVGGALVGAAHDVDGVQVAEGLAGDAF